MPAPGERMMSKVLSRGVLALLKGYDDPSETNLHVPPSPQYILYVQPECAEAALKFGLLGFDEWMKLRAGKVVQSKLAPDVWLAMKLDDLTSVQMRLAP